MTPAQLKAIAAAHTLTERQLLLLLRAELRWTAPAPRLLAVRPVRRAAKHAGPPWSSATAGGGGGLCQPCGWTSSRNLIRPTAFTAKANGSNRDHQSPNSASISAIISARSSIGRPTTFDSLPLVTWTQSRPS